MNSGSSAFMGSGLQSAEALAIQIFVALVAPFCPSNIAARSSNHNDGFYRVAVVRF